MEALPRRDRAFESIVAMRRVRPNDALSVIELPFVRLTQGREPSPSNTDHAIAIRVAPDVSNVSIGLQ